MSANRSGSRVLWFPSGQIGDTLMLLSICDDLLAQRPQTEIFFFVRRNKDLVRSLAARYPSIQVVSLGAGIWELWRVLSVAMRGPFTALMPAAFGKGFRSTNVLFTLLNLLAGSVTAGLVREGEHAPYSRCVPYDRSVLFIDNLRSMVRVAGLIDIPNGSPVSVTIPIEPITDGLDIPHKGTYIVFHPFGSSTWKSFPPRRCRALLMAIRERYPGIACVVTGSNADKEAAERIVDGMAGTSVAIGLPLPQLAHLLQESRVYIGVDTGITHLASVLRRKSIVLGHRSDPIWLPYYNPHATVLFNERRCECSGVKSDHCAAEVDGVLYRKCLIDIDDESILSHTRGML